MFYFILSYYFFLFLVEHFVLLYSKLLFLFIISGTFCLLYFKLILLLFLVDHKKIKKIKNGAKREYK